MHALVLDNRAYKVLENLSDCFTRLPTSNKHGRLLILQQFGSPIVQDSLHTLVLWLSGITVECFIIEYATCTP